MTSPQIPDCIVEEIAKGSLFIVEDHPRLRERLEKFIESFPEFRFAGAASDAESALEELNLRQPDLVLIDHSLPGMSGLALIALVKARWPRVRCVLYSGYRKHEYLTRAFAAGADGVISKGNPVDLIDGVRRVMAGERFVSANLCA
jgi:DNA-binding NarL/FixJ family response regulator